MQAKSGNAQSPLFVRRAPEDYEKPKRMASALTARLSQPQEQSRREECGFDGGGSRSFLCRGPLAGEMLPGSLKQWCKDLAGGTPSTQADETVDLTVHVQSPFEVPTVVNPVPGCMTLASLRNEVCHAETLEPGTPPPPSVLALNHFSGGSEISAGARTPAASGICGRKVTFDALSDDDKTPTAAWHRRTDDACHTGTAKAPTDNVCPGNGQAVQQKKSEIFNVRTRSDSDVMKRSAGLFCEPHAAQEVFWPSMCKDLQQNGTSILLSFQLFDVANRLHRPFHSRVGRSGDSGARKATFPPRAR